VLFHLTPEQVAIQDAVRGTLGECWGVDRLHAFAEGEDDFDETSWQALMDLGIGGLVLAAADGGAGLGLLDAALVCEIVGEAAAPGPIIGQIIGAIAVANCRDPAVRALLPGIASGEKVVALALDSDLVQGARAAHLFIARDNSGGLRLIEAGECVEIVAVSSTDRSRPVSRVRFGAAKAYPLFTAGEPMVDRLTDAALVLIAADALGGAQHCADLSVEYAKTREQFGQPIGRFQGLKHQLVQMALEVEPARALVWYAAYAWDASLADSSRAAAMAKAHLCDVYTRTTRAAVAAHGGIGYTWEYGLNYWFRRSIADRAWLGSPAQHRARAADLAGW
jgi:alkylation response protein AidB-like acyl-CoA dehydrogenase